VKTLTLSERIDQFIASAPRSAPWYDTKNRCWRPGHVYITKKAVMALLLELRRERALQAMAELDAEIAAEEAAKRRGQAKRKARLARKPRRSRARPYLPQGGETPRPATYL
jgi:hypothetical protein